MEKMVQIEEMTECSSVAGDTDGQSTIDEGTEKCSFREGQGIAIAMARLGDEDMDHFYPQKSGEINRIGDKYTFRI